MSRLLKTVAPLAAGMRAPLAKAQEKALDTAHVLLDVAVHGAGWSAVRLAAAYRAACALSVDAKQKWQHRLQHRAQPKPPAAMTTEASSSRTPSSLAEQALTANSKVATPIHTLAEPSPIQAEVFPATPFVQEAGNATFQNTASDAPITQPLLPADKTLPRDRSLMPERPNKPKAPKPKGWPASWIFSLALVLGLIVGAAFMATAGWLWLRMPYASEGADFNGDGIMDSTRTVSASGQTLRIEIDRNMDGKIDRIQTTNLRGQIESSLSDDDFDGVFESQAWFSNGQLESSQTDADGDGFSEIRNYYPYGVKATTRHIDPQTHRDVRIEHFKLGVLAFAIEDIDGDGKINHRIDYSPTGQVLRTSKLKQQP
jgi:hypothetical protein